MLIHQRHLREFVDYLVQSGYVIKDAHDGRNLVKEILAIPEQRVHHKFLLEEQVSWRRLDADALQPRLLDDCHLRSPVRSPTNAMHCDARFIDLRPGAEVLNHTRQHNYSARNKKTGLEGPVASNGLI